MISSFRQHPYLWLLLPALLFALLFLAPVNTDVLGEELLPEGRLDGLARVLDPDHDATCDAEIWAEIGGITGLLALIGSAWRIVRILQAQVYKRRVEPAVALQVLRYVAFQAAFTLFAVIEAPICLRWKDIPHHMGRAAASFHLRASYRMQNFGLLGSNRECIGSIM